MPFCTNCGATVSGAFCVQCGTPAGAAAAQAQPAPPPASAYAQPAAPLAPPAPASTYAQPAAPVGPPVARKTSPIVWILVAVLGLFVLGGIAVVGVIGFVAHRAHQAGVSFDRGRDGGFSIQARGADGKDAKVEFGGGGKLPSWVPNYPGSQPHFAMQGTVEGGGESGQFYFDTSDSGSHVLSFYEDKCKDLGMKVVSNITTQDAGMITATDEGDRRSVVVVIAGQSSHTTVSVTYGKQ